MRLPMNVDVKYLASESWDGQMPERLRWLRENDPVHWSEADQVWLITKYDDVASISKNQELFSSAFGVWARRPKMTFS